MGGPLVVITLSDIVGLAMLGVALALAAFAYLWSLFEKKKEGARIISPKEDPND